MRLIDQLLDHIPYDVVSNIEIAHYIDKSDAARQSQVDRALAKGDLLQIRRGLYYLSQRYQRHEINVYELAQKIYGPSYVSFESALSFHGLIPEAVYNITSASAKRSQQFKTPVGTFLYLPIPIRAFFESVERIERNGHIFLMATPLKALADYVYANRLNWDGVEPVIQSLRIDKEELKFDTKEVDELEAAYRTLNVSAFLKGIKKDLDL